MSIIKYSRHGKNRKYAHRMGWNSIFGKKTSLFSQIYEIVTFKKIFKKVLLNIATIIYAFARKEKRNKFSKFKDLSRFFALFF